MIIAIIIFNPSTVLTVLLPILLCMLIFYLFTSFFPPFLYTYDPIWPLYKRKPFPQFYYFFFSSLLSTPFVHKKTLWMELLFFVFYHFFSPSFLTLYKVETLLLQQKKKTLFSTIRVLSSWPHPLHLCHFSLFLKQKM